MSTHALRVPIAEDSDNSADDAALTIRGLRAGVVDVPTLEREILLFEIGGGRYGLLSADVRELLRAVTITPLPSAPAIVEGLINLRGKIVPVLDIRARFRIPPKPLEASDHFVVAIAGASLVAIRVDRAIDLVRVDDRQIEKEKGILPGAEHVAGVAKLADGLVLIHDLRTFLTESEALALDEALRSAAGASP
jgi:purine-binding chemotaxis protein CheW